MAQAQLAADADAVGIADYAAGDLVDISKQQIRRFPTYTGQPQQLLHGAGDLSTVVAEQHLAGQHNIPGLVLVEAAGADIVLYIFNGGRRHGFQGWIGCKQGRGHQIHPGIGALGRQPHGDHQLIVLFVLQRADRVWVGVFQSGNDTADTFLQFHGSSSGKSVFLQYSMFFA